MRGSSYESYGDSAEPLQFAKRLSEFLQLATPVRFNLPTKSPNISSSPNTKSSDTHDVSPFSTTWKWLEGDRHRIPWVVQASHGDGWRMWNRQSSPSATSCV